MAIRIPPRFDNKIIEFIANGLTLQEMTEEFKKMNMDYSVGQIRKRVNKLKGTFYEISREILTKTVEETMAQDHHILDTVISTLFLDFQKAKSLDHKIKIAHELSAWNERRIKITGILKSEDEVDHEAARIEMIEQLEFAKKEAKSNSN